MDEQHPAEIREESNPPTRKNQNKKEPQRKKKEKRQRKQRDILPPPGAIVRARNVPNPTRQKNGLLRFASNVTSQGGEDGILKRIFELLPPPKGEYRYCVDVGAWDGKHWSNTYSLLVHHEAKNQNSTNTNEDPKSNLWRGVLIEAHPERFQQLCQLHQPRANDVACLNSMVSCLPNAKDSLAKIIQNVTFPASPYTCLPLDFDLLCIDVDGTDYWLLYDVLMTPVVREGEPLGYYRPKVLLVEFNPTIPHTVVYVQPRHDQVRQGCSIAALYELLVQETQQSNLAEETPTSTTTTNEPPNLDYILVETTLYNAFFVQRSLYEHYLQKDVIENPTLERLHEITMGTSLYQLYDGTLLLDGCKRLLWQKDRRKMDLHKMQLVKKEDRTFPFAPPTPTLPSNTLHTGATPKSQTEQEEKGCVKQKLITTVDMSPYRQPTMPKPGHSMNDTDAARHACSQDLLTHLTHTGFAMVQGTGMSPHLCLHALQATSMLLQDDFDFDGTKTPQDSSNTRDQTPALISQIKKQFLKEKDAVRQSCISKTDKARRGYSPPCTENFASLMGRVGPHDLVRKFRLGPTAIESAAVSASSPSSSSVLLRNENVWPSKEVWGDTQAAFFRSSVEGYYHNVRKVAEQVVQSLCRGLLESLEEHLHERNATKKAVTDVEHMPSSPLVSKFTGLMKEELLAVKSNLHLLLGNNTLSASTPTTDTLQKSNDNTHTSILTLLGYRVGKRHTKKRPNGTLSPLVAPHTDVGVITVLLFDDGDCAVLQRWSGGCDAASDEIKKEGEGSWSVGGWKHTKEEEEDDSNWTDVVLPSLVLEQEQDGDLDQENNTEKETPKTLLDKTEVNTKDAASITKQNQQGNECSGSPTSEEVPQVCKKQKQEFRDPCLVVNIGDCLSDLTCGVLPSTVHRVMPVAPNRKHNVKKKHNKEMKPRNCLALFVGLHPEAILSLPKQRQAQTEELQPNESPAGSCAVEQMTYEEWRKRRIARASKVLEQGRAKP